MTPREIEAAIQNAFDGTLDEEGCRMLREILKADRSARVLYFEHASLHQGLLYRLRRIQPLETVHSMAEARLRFQIRRSVRISIAIAAVLLLALGLTLKLVLVPEPAALATFQVAAGSRFTVEQAASDTAPPSSELREGARVRLDQGSLEIRIDKGSRAVVLAPASFRIDAANRMRLDEGTAWFEIGKDAKGFQISTPEMTVTDLGTRFGVLASHNAGHEVHVFSGRVIARGHAAQGTEESLTTGMARRCDPLGRLKVVEVRPDLFLTTLPADAGLGMIVNGDFESGNPPPARTYGPHATAALLPGWRFGRDIIVVSATSEGRPGYGEDEVTILSSTADVQVGFNSETDHRPGAEAAALYQTFATTPGREYEVRFEMGAVFFESAAMEITAAIHDGGAPGGPPTGPALGSWIERRESSAGSGYNPPARFFFTAASESSTLVFTETSSRSISADPVIDNVSVTAK